MLWPLVNKLPGQMRKANEVHGSFIFNSHSYGGFLNELKCISYVRREILYFYELLFFPDFITITTIPTIMAITMKIPKPIPALKIPATASQEVRSSDIINREKTVTEFAFFID